MWHVLNRISGLCYFRLFPIFPDNQPEMYSRYSGSDLEIDDVNIYMYVFYAVTLQIRNAINYTHNKIIRLDVCQ